MKPKSKPKPAGRIVRLDGSTCDLKTAPGRLAVDPAGMLHIPGTGPFEAARLHACPGCHGSRWVAGSDGVWCEACYTPFLHCFSYGVLDVVSLAWEPYPGPKEHNRPKPQPALPDVSEYAYLFTREHYEPAATEAMRRRTLAGPGLDRFEGAGQVGAYRGERAPESKAKSRPKAGRRRRA